MRLFYSRIFYVKNLIEKNTLNLYAIRPFKTGVYCPGSFYWGFSFSCPTPAHSV